MNPCEEQEARQEQPDHGEILEPGVFLHGEAESRLGIGHEEVTEEKGVQTHTEVTEEGNPPATPPGGRYVDRCPTTASGRHGGWVGRFVSCISFSRFKTHGIPRSRDQRSAASEDSIEDSLRIGPAGLVLSLAAPLQDRAEPGTGLQSAPDQMAAEDRVAGRGVLDATGAGGGEEGIAGVEAAGEGVGGGASEMVLHTWDSVTRKPNINGIDGKGMPRSASFCEKKATQVIVHKPSPPYQKIRYDARSMLL